MGSLILGLGLSTPSAAEVVLDGSIGPSGRPPGSSTQVTIPSSLGQIHGANLFHSFLKFSIAPGESVTFTGPGTIENIIGRVTGGKPSLIDGSLRSEIPNANLWLINPVGVMFGSHASLSINGSFHVTTANYLKLGSDGRFDAANPERTVLTSAPPSAFGFLQGHPSSIVFDGAGLEPEGEEVFRVSDGKTFSVVGGDISIRGESIIKSVGGLINLISVASPGEVTIGERTLNTAVFGRLGHIRITEQADIGEEMFNGAGILIRSGKLTINNATLSSFNTDSPGKGVDIRVRGDVILRAAGIDTSSGGSGQGGGISIKAGRLVMKDGSTLLTRAHDQGNGGTVSIDTGNSQLTDGSLISTETNASGQAGNISIRSGKLTLDHGSEVLAMSTDLAVGAGGRISIQSNSLNLDDGSKVSAESTGVGRAGRIDIKGANDLHLSNGSKITVASKTADAGSIDIQVRDRLVLQSGSQISTSVADGKGNGGNITIDPFVTALMGGSSIIARARAGSGGNISITTDNLFVSPDSVIDASSQLGIDGTVLINSPETYISGGLTRLPAVFLNTTSLLTRACHERLGDEAGSLTVRRYELLPDSPYALSAQLPSATGRGDAGQRVSLAQPYLWPAGGCPGRTWQRLRSLDRHAELAGHRT